MPRNRAENFKNRAKDEPDNYSQNPNRQHNPRLIASGRTATPEFSRRQHKLQSLPRSAMKLNLLPIKCRDNSRESGISSTVNSSSRRAASISTISSRRQGNRIRRSQTAE